MTAVYRLVYKSPMSPYLTEYGLSSLGARNFLFFQNWLPYYCSFYSKLKRSRHPSLRQKPDFTFRFPICWLILHKVQK